MQRPLIALILLFVLSAPAHAQVFDEQLNGMGDNNGSDRRNGKFNPHGNDSTKTGKQIPKGIHVWTVDRKFGDITPAQVDTVPHLFPQATMNTGLHGEYNTTGNNYTARQSRIFMDRSTETQFALTDSYSYILKRPDEWHFTNTLSPITNLWYDNCGDKNYGEDHVDARFAVNAGKRIGIGFDLNYAYARGYYQSQSTSHFASSLYGSYLGDHYQAHLLFSTNHQKAAENGGILNDNYITHPELFNSSFSENEIPTMFTENWNRDHNYHLFLTHRYNLGFYREVKMTDEEIAAKKFAEQSKKEQEDKKVKKTASGNDRKKQTPGEEKVPAGRPDGAKIVSEELPPPPNDSLATDTTRIHVTSTQMADSIKAIEAQKDSLAQLMKREFVPVTSFIHTMELDHYEHVYQSYDTPTGYYANTYYKSIDKGYSGDSIYDKTRHLSLKNTLALGLLEGFNKWARAGIKAFATHQLRRYEIPAIDNDSNYYRQHFTEHNVSVGGMLSKKQGKTLHYNLMGELWVTGEESGQLKVDFSTDLNFPLFGDTMQLAAKTYFYRLHPDVFFRHYHSKHIWWDHDDLEKTTRTRIEGIFSYKKSNTRLRLSIEEMQNYTYLGMRYDDDGESRKSLSASVIQKSGNINVLTAQIEQPLALGPLHWDNIVTYQSSSDQDALPLPTINVFSNLYLKFLYAGVLSIELGAAATYFTEYEVPDYCPMLNMFAVQQNTASRVKLGNQPFVDVYANLHLKHARFFVMMSNVTGSSLRRMNFLVPHYPQNNSILHFGVSWNFFN